MTGTTRWILLGLSAWLAACSPGEEAAMPAEPPPSASAADQAGLDSLGQLERTAAAGDIDLLPVWEGIVPEAVEPGCSGCWPRWNRLSPPWKPARNPVGTG